MVFLEPARRVRLRPLFRELVAAPIDERYRTWPDRASRAHVGMGWEGLGATLTALAGADGR